MDNVFQRVYEITARIPYGRVTTYGQIARLLGNPRLSRIVGCALNGAPADLPCHRVVNRLGGLSDAFSPLGKESQRLLLGALPAGWRGGPDGLYVVRRGGIKIPPGLVRPGRFMSVPPKRWPGQGCGPPPPL